MAKKKKKNIILGVFKKNSMSKNDITDNNMASVSLKN